MLDFPQMQHDREDVVRALLAALGIPGDIENIQNGGRFNMWLSHINGAPFMPFKFGHTPFGLMLWQLEQMVVL